MFLTTWFDKFINIYNNIYSIYMETVTIPKAEYEYLKTHAKNIDWELVEQFRKGLKDLKAGKFIKC